MGHEDLSDLPSIGLDPPPRMAPPEPAMGLNLGEVAERPSISSPASTFDLGFRQEASHPIMNKTSSSPVSLKSTDPLDQTAHDEPFHVAQSDVTSNHATAQVPETPLATAHAIKFWKAYNEDIGKNISFVNTFYSSFCNPSSVSERALARATSVLEDKFFLADRVLAPWFALIRDLETHLPGIDRRTLLLVAFSQDPAEVPSINSSFKLMAPEECMNYAKVIQTLYRAHLSGMMGSRRAKAKAQFMSRFKISSGALNSWFNLFQLVLKAGANAHLPTLCSLLLSQVYCSVPISKTLVPHPKAELASGFPCTPQPLKVISHLSQSQLQQAGELHIQSRTCYSVHYNGFPKCTSCIAKKDNMCRFKLFRVFQVSEGDRSLNPIGFMMARDAAGLQEQLNHLELSDASRPATLPEPPNLTLAPNSYVVANVSVRRASALYTMAQIQSPLLTLLDKEVNFITNNLVHLHYRKQLAPVRQVCDGCNTGIFSAFWFCSTCGREYCLDCYSNWEAESAIRVGALERCCYRETHTRAHLCPVVGYLPEKIFELHNSPSPILPNRRGLVELSLFGFRGFDSPLFQSYWQLGQPILLKNSPGAAKYTCTPQHFIDYYGNVVTEVLRPDGSPVKSMTIAEFFSRFDAPEFFDSDLKIKDFPSSDRFSDTMPHLYRDFMNQLPAPEYMAYEGSRNLVSLLPATHIAPDLGPKMYVAYAGKNGDLTGTTPLHLDASDAINVLRYSAGPQDQPGAVWHLFRREDTEGLRRFIASKAPHKLDDPIHDQSFYLSQTLLLELFEREKIRPYVIHQMVNEVVLIPAGCPHQVRNLYPCIKLAMDYVAPEGAAYCAKLAAEFRKLPHGHLRNVDLLNTTTLLAYAWLSCSRTLGLEVPIGDDDILAKPVSTRQRNHPSLKSKVGKVKADGKSPKRPYEGYVANRAVSDQQSASIITDQTDAAQLPKKRRVGVSKRLTQPEATTGHPTFKVQAASQADDLSPNRAEVPGWLPKKPRVRSRSPSPSTRRWFNAVFVFH
ncbi:hypothetical protein L0F63_000614 [Massospora cicadina]|nr:hypothetical protein L0F63_000614 [Massospora cicadina]